MKISTFTSFSAGPVLLDGHQFSTDGWLVERKSPVARSMTAQEEG
jgi:hypothetical protein